MRRRGGTPMVSCVVIVVTGYGRAQDAALARRSGADQFFITPLLPEALELAIEQALDCLRIGQRPPWNGPTLPLIVVKTPAARATPERHLPSCADETHVADSATG